MVNFTLRQWGVIAALSAGFIVAAIIVSKDSLTPQAVEVQAFDETVWCETANAISTWRSILDGSVDGDTLADTVNLQTTLDEARAIAPAELRTNVARLFDFALLMVQAVERADGDLALALLDAQSNTDQVRVQQAIASVSGSVEGCGHTPLTTPTA
ncbi:MAG: hypothetical protein CL433_03455 [Acidimicrobiaceae bacterium]|jgi:hypothetical protein|nr:hypothetical protein [Acidimicrobiaceae bacterium]